VHIKYMQRYSFFALTVVLAVVSLGLSFWSLWFLIPLAIFGALSLLGVNDVNQTKHSITRNYPVIGHMRFLFEGFRPEIRQYLIEGEHDELPFSRDKRAIVYQRAKDVEDKRPFGTRTSMSRASPG